ncbi:MAG: glycosyltransferase [uncultured bacterium]|nr:MAG: glycosyltransferase [uncultured bacterium]
MVGGKGIREAIAGARKAGVVLKIVGETVGAGIRKEELESRNVEYLGRVEDKELAKLYAGARGLVALSRDEDFGMTVVEAMAMGTPVLAFNGGGYKETVVPGKTGILIEGTDAKTVAEGIRRMEQIKWEREKIGQWAKKFNRARFEKEIRGVVGA